MKKFFKTTITIEILSEKKYNSTDLEKIAYDITDGDCSGVVNVTEYKELTPVEAAKALLAQGSDPEFFGLDEEGISLDEEEVIEPELREAMLENGSFVPVDTYYQPVLTETEMIQNDFYSFQVYRNKANAEKDFPGKEIKEYSGLDIEDPTFVDDTNSFE